MSDLPRDPFLLLSYINTKLRDEYASFDEFCAEEGVDRAQTEAALASIGYAYRPEQNRFA